MHKPLKICRKKIWHTVLLLKDFECETTFKKSGENEKLILTSRKHFPEIKKSIISGIGWLALLAGCQTAPDWLIVHQIGNISTGGVWVTNMTACSVYTNRLYQQKYSQFLLLELLILKLAHFSALFYKFVCYNGEA